MPFEFDVELSIAAVKLRLYRDFFDTETKTWTASPLARPHTQVELANILDPAQPKELKKRHIDPKWVGDLFTDPYGLVGGRRAPDRVVRAALHVCSIDEVRHQPGTTVFLSSMEKVATTRYEDQKQRLQAFRDHYDPVFRELLRLANITLPDGYDPDEDDGLESSVDNVGMAGDNSGVPLPAEGLSLDGAAMLANYYGWLCFLEVEAKIPNKRKIGWHTELAMSTSAALWHSAKKQGPADEVPKPLKRLYLLQSLCNELSGRVDMAATSDRQLALLLSRVRETDFFGEVDWLLSICDWRYDEARVALMVASCLGSYAEGDLVEKYALVVLDTIEKIMERAPIDEFDYNHPVFHFKKPILKGYETLANEPSLAKYMRSHEQIRLKYVASRPKKIKVRSDD